MSARRRAVLDACVLYPTVLRDILMGCARRALFEPIWSERLIEERIRAAARNGGDVDAQIARADAARLAMEFPQAMIPASPPDPALWLPDPDDVHVLATARSGRAVQIITLNLRDFPQRELAVHGITATHPDAVLMDYWMDSPDLVTAAVHATHQEAERLSGASVPLRALLKRARLPRLGKALGT
jgi:hypothetical protein